MKTAKKPKAKTSFSRHSIDQTERQERANFFIEEGSRSPDIGGMLVLIGMGIMQLFWKSRWVWFSVGLVLAVLGIILSR
jgi:hypothetical protein